MKSTLYSNFHYKLGIPLEDSLLVENTTRIVLMGVRKWNHVFLLSFNSPLHLWVQGLFGSTLSHKSSHHLVWVFPIYHS